MTTAKRVLRGKADFAIGMRVKCVETCRDGTVLTTEGVVTRIDPVCFAIGEGGNCLIRYPDVIRPDLPVQVWQLANLPSTVGSVVEVYNNFYTRNEAYVRNAANDWRNVEDSSRSEGDAWIAANYVSTLWEQK